MNGSNDKKQVNIKPLISNNPNHNFKNSTQFKSSSSNSTNLENLIFLNSIKVNYPINEIPQELLRFIPDSQLELIRPLITKEDTSFISKKKYSTNVDERNYLTVFEYKLNDNNWIIWDYSTGYVFFTGLWKSCGNNKTDIVKLVENFPNLSNAVKRVRGGFLKIQGTWLPFDIVKNLAKNFCFNIRYCLIPIFGEDFPNQCLKPSDLNFGKLIDLNSQHQILSSQQQQHRRRRSSTNTSSSNIIKPIFKKRSKSDNFTNSSSLSKNKIQLIELEEILKASKSLHDLSSTSSNYNLFSKVKNFQYGGFVWSWNDNNNLCIIGKDNENVIIDDDEEAAVETVVSAKNHSDPSIPKNYDGIDTILNAAHQLMNFHTGGSNDSSIVKQEDVVMVGPDGLKRRKSKMDIDGLLS